MKKRVIEVKKIVFTFTKSDCERLLDSRELTFTQKHVLKDLKNFVKNER